MNNIIVGLHNDEDSGICLLKDGEILEAVSEERFNRRKLYKGIPEKSLKYVLSKYNLKLDQIDYFAYGWHGKYHDCREYAEKLATRIVQALKCDASCGDMIIDRISVEREKDTETLLQFQQWMKDLGIPDDRIFYLDHHECHAWSGFAPSPFEEAIVFTFDGRGDLKSASISYAKKEKGIMKYDYLLTFDSIGYLYGKITNYLGYKPHRHEGKVTGLASYGDPNKTLPLFQKLISWKNNTIEANLGYYKPFFSIKEALRKELDKYSREDIAAGVQKHCEDLIVQFISYWINKINKPGAKAVCLAGGVFANVRINQRVAEIDNVDSVYVFPHMGDGGLPVGSACYVNYLLTGQTKINLPTVYCGPEYPHDIIADTLKKFSSVVSFNRLHNKVETIVADLIQKKVVGYFDMRMEYGPRALGARSILVHARDRSVNDWLNKRLRRTEFMPFAPVTPVEYATECYVNWKREDVCSYFMTITYDCTESFKQRHKGVVHVDGTARPQIVTGDLHGDYYRVVKGYCDRTGDRALINTSFNQHEEPIVCSPRDAIQGLLRDGVDVLYLADFRVVKQ